MKLFAFTQQQLDLIKQVVRKVLLDEFPANQEERHTRRPFEGQQKEGLLDETLTAPGGTATLSVYTGDQAGWADASYNIEVEWPTGEGVEITSGSYLRVVRINGAWRPATGVC